MFFIKWTDLKFPNYWVDGCNRGFMDCLQQSKSLVHMTETIRPNLHAQEN
jgi:hypothetical protein